VVALACQLPAATGVPLARWSGPELAAEITKAGLARPISPSSILQILAGHPIKPRQYQSWICPRGPGFAAKATVILDLYPGVLPGQTATATRPHPVGGRQALHPGPRPLPPRQPGQGRPVRVEHQYQRNGAPALLAALDVHTGKVFAATPTATGIAPFMDLIAQVISQPPYKNDLVDPAIWSYRVRCRSGSGRSAPG
jgi:hypothetical protein